MVTSVTVVTGADTRYRQTFEHFACMEYGVEHADVIFRPDAELALARADRFMPAEMQFVVRDVLETQIQLSVTNHHPIACVLICKVACNRHAPGFEECVGFARRVQEALGRMRFFSKYHLACLTPNREILTIQPNLRLQ